MHLLNKLEDRFGRFAVPNVTLGLIIVQVLVFVIAQTPRHDGDVSFITKLMLIPDLVLVGEVWRLATFLAVPPFDSLLWCFFFWYMFYFMGTALEHFWGTFKYNVYLLIGYVATVAVSFITPDLPSSNAFLEGSVFLAFAFLCPDFVMYIFFILPVKIKWLALLTWIGYGVTVIFGGWLSRLLVLASVCNFLLFFWSDILERVRSGQRHMAQQAARFQVKEPAFFHRCTVCGITDRSHPDMEFRYCSKCEGTLGYCMNHLHDHEHVTEAP